MKEKQANKGLDVGASRYPGSHVPDKLLNN